MSTTRTAMADRVNIGQTWRRRRDGRTFSVRQVWRVDRQVRMEFLRRFWELVS